MTGVERAAAEIGHTLALDAERAVQRKKREIFSSEATRSYTVIAEGDSWFSHPLNTTVIDVLQADGYEIHNLAEAGDTLERMVARKEYKADLKRGTVKHFLFSGGGNDFLGEELERCVHGIIPDHVSPGDAPLYVTTEFAKRLNDVRHALSILLGDIASLSPSTVLILHGYAYSRPQVAGPYLGKHFEQIGFDLQRHLELARAIVRNMVDRFNSNLEALASSSRLVKYIDFRRTIRQDDDKDWYDYELHPSPRAAKKMAKLYRPLLDSAQAAVA